MNGPCEVTSKADLYYRSTQVYPAASMCMHGLWRVPTWIVGHCGTHAQHNLHGKGGKNPTFPAMHWVFNFNTSIPIYANTTMVLFQHVALGNQHHHLPTLGPLPYNISLSAIKPNKTGFCWT